MLNESVVLFGSTLVQRLEPVSVVCNSILFCPLSHATCYCVSNRTVKTNTIIHNVDEFCINIGWQVFVHLGTVEDIFTIIL